MPSPSHRRALLYFSAWSSHVGIALAAPTYAACFAAKTAGVKAFSWFFAALGLPPILLRPVFQWLFQRVPLSTLLVVLQVSRASCTLFLAYLMRYDRLTCVSICGGMAVLSALNHTFITAFFLQLPRWVSSTHITKFVSRSSAFTQLGWFTGSFFLATQYGKLPNWCYLRVDGVLYLLSAFILYVLRNDVASLSVRPLLPAPSLRDSPHVVWQQAFALALPFILLSYFRTLTTPLTLKISLGGVPDLALLGASSNMGMLLVGFSYAYWPKRLRCSPLLYRAALLMGWMLLLVFLWLPRANTLCLGLCSMMLGVMYLVMLTWSRSHFYHTAYQKYGVAVTTLSRALMSGGGFAVQVLVPLLLTARYATTVLVLGSGVLAWILLRGGFRLCDQAG